MNEHRRFWYGLIAVGVCGLLILVSWAIWLLVQVLDGIKDQQDDIEKNIETSQAIATSLKEQRESDTAIRIVTGACAAGFGELPNDSRIRSTMRCVADWLDDRDASTNPFGG
jgi:hypothetical protein